MTMASKRCLVGPAGRKATIPIEGSVTVDILDGGAIRFEGDFTEIDRQHMKPLFKYRTIAVVVECEGRVVFDGDVGNPIFELK